jgi:hypothetical protein
MQQLKRFFVKLHVRSKRDRRRLGTSDKMAPAPGLACGMKPLHYRLMMFEGVHLGEVIMADDLGQAFDIRCGIIAENDYFPQQGNTHLRAGFGLSRSR